MKSNVRPAVNARRSPGATASPGSAGARPAAQDAFGTIESDKAGGLDGAERDEGSVGASSRGIRPYQSKSRKGSVKESRSGADQQDATLGAAQELLASAGNVRATDEDSFALDVQRVPGSSAKNLTASKSMGRRPDFLDPTPDHESFKLNINTVEEGEADAEDGS